MENQNDQQELNLEEKSLNNIELEQTQGGKKQKRTQKAGKRKGNEWTKLVTKTYKTNHKRNKEYTFKQAIQDSRKLYKRGGNQQNQEQEEEEENQEQQQQQQLGGKRKSRKSAKKDRK
jgi:hypothetical protein